MSLITTVHNIHKEEMDENSIYIGRRRGAGGDGLGNPYKVGRDGIRSEVITKYRRYFLARMRDDQDNFNEKIEKLRGKRLFCFCAPLPCHGDVIAEWLNQ